MDGGLGEVGCKQVRREEREEIRPLLLPTGLVEKPGFPHMNNKFPLAFHLSCITSRLIVKGSIRLDVWPAFLDRPVSLKRACSILNS